MKAIRPVISLFKKDNNVESVESFYVVLEDPVYSILGSNTKVKVNIMDKKKGKNIFFSRDGIGSI